MQHAFAMLFSFFDKAVFVWAVTDLILLFLFTFFYAAVEQNLTTAFQKQNSTLRYLNIN